MKGNPTQAFIVRNLVYSAKKEVAQAEDDFGNQLSDQDCNPIVAGYLTDEGMDDNKDYTGGRLHGWLDSIPTTEYNYQVVADGLEPNTTYYYQVGSEESRFSDIGTFTTTFIHYTHILRTLFGMKMC